MVMETNYILGEIVNLTERLWLTFFKFVFFEVDHFSSITENQAVQNNLSSICGISKKYI